jgi:predicted Zn-dependent protease
LRVLLSEQPEHGKAPARWLRLGQVLLPQAETTDELLEAADKALELAPGDGSLRRQACQLFQSAGAWAKARALLRREIELAEPTQLPELLRELARIDWDELGDAEAAGVSLKELARSGSLESEDRLRWADALAQQERWPESFDQRRQALDALGKMAPARAWLDLAEAELERTGDAASALDSCNRTMDCDPDLNEALALRADVHAKLGNVLLELEDRIRLGKRLPPGPEAAEALAHAGRLAYDELKDEVQARALFQAALERDSSRVSALLGAGRIALNHEEWSEAERMLGLACSLLRENSEGQALAHVAASAAHAALKQEHKSEAFLYLELALEHEPHHPEALDAMAELSLERGAYAQARRCLETRLADSDLPPSARAERLAQLAKTCEASGDLGSAASALAELTSLRPKDESACTQALDLFERLGASERAVAEIDAWIERVPSERRMGLALRAARFEVHMGRVAEARQRLEALLQVEGDRPEAWVELSGLVFEHDGSEAALGITQRGLALLDAPSERAPLLWIEAQALLALERVSEAAPRAYDALVADPSNIAAARMLAAHLGLAGDWKQAASQLESTLVVTDPSEPIQAELWEAIGRAYAGPLEDIERAERCYRRALECNRWHSSAREALADVTAFDPASHPESIRQHRALLEEFPARIGSWRALVRIANYWKRSAVKQTCETVLDTLTSEGPRGEVALSRLGAAASAPPLIAAATEVMRAFEEGSVLSASEPTPSADTLEGEISLAIRNLAGHWWELGDEALRSVWRRAITANATGAAEIRRRARRRIRRALRGIEREALCELDPDSWRAQILAQAAAMVLSEGKHSLADVLLHLLAHWPTTSHLGVCVGGDLGAAVQLCPPARALLLRIRDAALDALGL